MRPEHGSLAVERTALGWQRAGVSLAAIAALVVAQALHVDEPLGAIAAVVPAAGSAWALLRGRGLYGRRAGGERGAAQESLRVLVAITLAVAIVSGGLVVLESV
jgi:hypothetical protein